MELIQEILTARGRKLQLIKGDLANLPESDKVDVLLISAFPNDYVPEANSLMGSLFTSGLSVAALAEDKEADLRTHAHCWLSKEINFNNIKRILCFEPTDRQYPFNLIAGVFQSIIAFADTYSIETVALPLILTGKQGYSGPEVMKELLSTSLFWLENDSPIKTIKIIENNDAKIDLLKKAFEAQTFTLSKKLVNDKYDFFISYSRKNAVIATMIQQKLASKFSLFFDKESIDVGTNWLNKINVGLEKSERFIVCISPDYIESKMCRYEYMFCNLQLINKGDDYVLPLYLYSATLPFPMQILNYHDAREGKDMEVEEFCNRLIQKYGH